MNGALRKFLRPAKRWFFHVRLLRDSSFRYFGARVYFPRQSHVVRRAIAEGIYEKNVLDILSSSAKSGTTIVDIGANIGLISVALLSRCPAVRVVSFEPASHVFDHLARTQQESGYGSRWEIRSLCLTNREGQQEFHLPPSGEDAFAGMVPTGRTKIGKFVNVACSTLDAEWSRLAHPAISVIKIDVEGGEMKVLEGARDTIRSCRPIIVIEWNGTNLAANGESPARLLTFCNDLGYSIHPVPGLFEISTEEILLTAMRQTESFLLVPRSHT